MQFECEIRLNSLAYWTIGQYWPNLFSLIGFFVVFFFCFVFTHCYGQYFVWAESESVVFAGFVALTQSMALFFRVHKQLAFLILFNEQWAEGLHCIMYFLKKYIY